MGQSYKFGYGAMLAVSTHSDLWACGTRNMKVSLGKVLCRVRRLGGGVYVVQASWSMEDHGSVRRVSLGGR
jgi:hypothetical protein